MADDNATTRGLATTDPNLLLEANTSIEGMDALEDSQYLTSEDGTRTLDPKLVQQVTDAVNTLGSDLNLFDDPRSREERNVARMEKAGELADTLNNPEVYKELVTQKQSNGQTWAEMYPQATQQKMEQLTTGLQKKRNNLEIKQQDELRARDKKFVDDVYKSTYNITSNTDSPTLTADVDKHNTDTRRVLTTMLNQGAVSIASAEKTLRILDDAKATAHTVESNELTARDSNRLIELMSRGDFTAGNLANNYNASKQVKAQYNSAKDQWEGTYGKEDSRMLTTIRESKTIQFKAGIKRMQDTVMNQQVKDFMREGVAGFDVSQYEIAHEAVITNAYKQHFIEKGTVLTPTQSNEIMESVDGKLNKIEEGMREDYGTWVDSLPERFKTLTDEQTVQQGKEVVKTALTAGEAVPEQVVQQVVKQSIDTIRTAKGSKATPYDFLTDSVNQFKGMMEDSKTMPSHNDVKQAIQTGWFALEQYMNEPSNKVDERVRVWFNELEREAGTEGTLPDSFIDDLMDGSIFRSRPRLKSYEAELGLEAGLNEFGVAMSELMAVGRKPPVEQEE